MTTNRWSEYEMEKRRIAESSESAAEYDRRIRELVIQLGL